MLLAMRTTLDLDDDVLRAARALAEQRGTSLGAAVSELVLRGLRPSTPRESVSGFPVMVSRAPGHVITDDLVAQHRDD